MPRYEGTDQNHASHKTDIQPSPANLQDEADADRAAGRDSVGTRGGRPIAGGGS